MIFSFYNRLMPTIIRLAKITQELNDILDLRFLIQQQLQPQTTSRGSVTQKLIDPLDVLPSTLNLYAARNGQAVACLRITEYQVDNPIQNFSFSFHESAKNLEGKPFVLDMFCSIDQSEVARMTIRSLIQMAQKTLGDLKATHAFFVAPLVLADELEKLGFQALSEKYLCPRFRAEVVPMYLNVDLFLKHFAETFQDQEIFRFREIFYHTVFQAGEIMAEQGEQGATAYFINEGEVDVLVLNESAETLIKIATLKSGSLIGEIAMLTSEPRNASLVVKEPTACIAFDRSEFLRVLYQDPHRSLDIFKIFSKRITESNRKLAEAQKC